MKWISNKAIILKNDIFRYNKSLLCRNRNPKKSSGLQIVDSRTVMTHCTVLTVKGIAKEPQKM